MAWKIETAALAGVAASMSGDQLLAGVGRAGSRRSKARYGEDIQAFARVAWELAILVVNWSAADAAQLGQRGWCELDAMHFVQIRAGLFRAHELRPTTRQASGCLGQGALHWDNPSNCGHRRFEFR
jgi:hypothetical protein